jgi:hypothetical protein
VEWGKSVSNINVGYRDRDILPLHVRTSTISVFP